MSGVDFIEEDGVPQVPLYLSFSLPLSRSVCVCVCVSSSPSPSLPLPLSQSLQKDFIEEDGVPQVPLSLSLSLVVARPPLTPNPPLSPPLCLWCVQLFEVLNTYVKKKYECGEMLIAPHMWRDADRTPYVARC